jgi:hypothetical protein
VQTATPRRLRAASICARNIPIGDIGLDEAEHVGGGLVDLEENTVVDLAQAEELQNLAGLGADSVDTGIK